LRPPTLQAEFKKAEGNKAHAKKDYSAAIRLFSEAIELDPSNHVYYSNRSACLLEVGRFAEAKADGERCVSIDPTWPEPCERSSAATSA
jgi:stress-induced-phosphoprotein 1